MEFVNNRETPDTKYLSDHFLKEILPYTEEEFLNLYAEFRISVVEKIDYLRAAKDKYYSIQSLRSGNKLLFLSKKDARRFIKEKLQPYNVEYILVNN